MAIQGWCEKKLEKISDSKVIEFCLKQNFKKNCIWLRWRIWRIERSLKWKKRKS